MRLIDAFSRAWKARSRRLFAMCAASAIRTSSAIGTFSTRAIASSSAACSSVNRSVIDFGISASWYHGSGRVVDKPSICAVSSTEYVFDGFELVSRAHWPISSRFQPPTSPGLLHELLHRSPFEWLRAWADRTIERKMRSPDGTSSASQYQDCPPPITIGAVRASRPNSLRVNTTLHH